jgi:hypothetical protein
MADEDAYIAKVLKVLYGNPTAQSLDFLVEAFAYVGQLAGDAESLAERATFARKHAHATAYLNAKKDPKRTERVTDKEAEALALTDTAVEAHREAEANDRARKLKNLLEAIEQAINAIKYLGRLT